MVKLAKSISVVITTFNRAWVLPYSLQSLVEQSVPPAEVIIVLKPSNDKSEAVISKFSKKLPIKLVIQNEGFIAQAAEMGLENASGDIILFMDDDAIAEVDFVKKYRKFFDCFRDAGGATGLILRAYFKNGHLVKTKEPYTPINVARSVPYRKPLNIFENYSGWISKSGLTTTTTIYRDDVSLDASLCGANMGLSKKAVQGCPLSELYKGSRKGFNYESLLAYFIRVRGYHTYKLINPSIAPIVWHITHKHHVTLRSSFWDDFWFSYDVLKNYFRYKKLGADVSIIHWVAASVALLRKNTPARLAALIYSFIS